ncbi:MAG: flavin reductase family protein [Planctomycetia bacterium]|nr:flavin reductase family protein [Planctomycetia bacterium]
MPFQNHTDRVISQLKRTGAFLTVKNGERVNSMTIGWGLLGIHWRMPIFVVSVRRSRYTYQLIDTAEDFTVSVPRDHAWDEALAFCGSRSGANVDKYEKCGMVMLPAREVQTPILEGGGFTYECRVVYKTPLDLMELAPGIREQFSYSAGDIHTLYFGKILASYEA